MGAIVACAIFAAISGSGPATVAAIAEALRFAHDFGVEARRLPDCLAGGWADSRVLQDHGRRMAAAYVAGYEVWCDLFLREPDHYYARGWHPTAVLGPVGAAAAAAVTARVRWRNSRRGSTGPELGEEGFIGSWLDAAAGRGGQGCWRRIQPASL